MTTVCTVAECGKPTLARGLCRPHYKRMMRHGTPTGGQQHFRVPQPAVCKHRDCSRPTHSRGYCAKHWGRLTKHGAPDAGGPEQGALPKWLLEHSDYRGDDCLIWPFRGSTDGRGYGHLTVAGRTVKAHRYMCTLAHGEPDGDQTDAAHSCGRGHLGCVNPRHLRWASKVENSADKVLHGTHLFGEAAPWAKLTESDVLYIRSKSGMVSQTALAEQFDVSASLVGLIQRGLRWKHLL